jgi:hypothetical protein
VTPGEARAAYVAADDEFAIHRSQCYACGNSRSKHRSPCPAGDPLRLVALDRRQDWARVVAESRAASSQDRQVQS